LRILEEKINEIGKDIKEFRDKMRFGKDRVVGDSEVDSNFSRSRRSSRTDSTIGESIYTCKSEGRLSMREVGRIKKLLNNKEKEERKNNIAIKEMRYDGDIRLLKEKVQEFLKEKLEINCKIKNCRISGTVIIAKLRNEETKREIMSRKNKLKGGMIFIETWEERKIQERINKWAKELKNRRMHIKIGIGKMKINGV